MKKNLHPSEAEDVVKKNLHPSEAEDVVVLLCLGMPRKSEISTQQERRY